MTEYMIILFGLALIVGLSTPFSRRFLVGFFIGLFPRWAKFIRNALLIRQVSRKLEKKR